MPTIPRSDHTWLGEALDGLRSRSRALKHKMHASQCERVIEEKDGERTERIDITFERRAAQGFVLRARIWQDRWVWIDVRAGGKSGWIFEWSIEGRSAGGLSGRELMQTVEATFDAISISNGIDQNALNNIWRGILLNGPRPV
jgi:hypothetical protein